MDASIYDYTNTLLQTISPVDATSFPLLVQVRFGILVDTFQFASTNYMDVSNVLGTHDATTLFTDGFGSDSGVLGSPPPPWTYADTETTSGPNALVTGTFSAGTLGFAGTTNTHDFDYQAAWSWISKEDIAIPQPLSPTTYTFTWDISTDQVGRERGVGLDDNGAPYPTNTYQMLVSGFNIFAATGSSAPYSPYGDFFFPAETDLSVSDASGGSPFIGSWGYRIEFTDIASSGLHAWSRI